MSEYAQMTRTSPGWERMWSALGDKGYDVDAYDPESGEAWQYMGTLDGEHTFRHRSLDGMRVYENVPVMDGDFDPVAVPDEVEL